MEDIKIYRIDDEISPIIVTPDIRFAVESFRLLVYSRKNRHISEMEIYSYIKHNKMMIVDELKIIEISKI